MLGLINIKLLAITLICALTSSAHSVSRLKVQNCNIYKNCGQCHGARDPYCGWCSLQHKCSLKSDCAQATRDPLYWVHDENDKCPTITTVHPHQIQRTTVRTLMLSIDNLPTVQGRFHCVFTAFGKVVSTNASRTASGLSCPTPPTDTLPSLVQHEHHLMATLSVRRNNGPDFVATNFTFYDCNTYRECTECVSSLFPCDWCIDSHRCTHDTGENCRNDFLVTGNYGSSFRSGPTFCPKINSSVTGDSEILISSGMRRAIGLNVDNIAEVLAQKRFVCQFNIEDRVLQVNAQLITDTMYCTDMEFKYDSQVPNVKVKFEIIREGNKPLENPEKVHVLVYRCRYMADNCGTCLALSEKYQCGWCESSLTCETKEQCDGGESAWLDQQKTCPTPKICNEIKTDQKDINANYAKLHENFAYLNERMSKLENKTDKIMELLSEIVAHQKKSSIKVKSGMELALSSECSSKCSTWANHTTLNLTCTLDTLTPLHLDNKTGTPTT